VQFLGQISKKALGFVYRAADLDNYYVAKLVVMKPGPLPVIGLQRYAVINGKPRPQGREGSARSPRATASSSACVWMSKANILRLECKVTL